MPELVKATQKGGAAIQAHRNAPTTTAGHHGEGGAPALSQGTVSPGTLDELLQRLKTQLMKLAPIIDLEILREPEGARTERGVTVGSQTIEHGRRSGA